MYFRSPKILQIVRVQGACARLSRLQVSEHLPHPLLRQTEGMVDAALLVRTLVVRFRSRAREC